MNVFEKIIYFLQGKMETPKPFGWFHLTCIILALIIIFILYKRKEKHSEKTLKIVLGTYGITAFLLEVLKQIIWSFNYNELTGVINWDYQWYAFPFQLCTTPIYVSIICLFLNKGKLRDSLLSYMAYITILGSIVTIIMPESCFASDILVNIHTMWLHIGSFIISIYILLTKEITSELKSFKQAIYVFIFFIIIAQILNIFIYNIGILNDETFNMFFISPYFNSTLPVFSTIQQNAPYIIFLLIYIILLTLGALIIFIIFKNIIKHKTKKI